MMTEQPVARGLLLCEKHVVEEGTRNITLVNCFTHRVSDRFPTPPQQFMAFAPLADGFGMFDMTLTVSQMDGSEPIFRRTERMAFVDRIKEGRFVLRVSDCVFRAPGPYAVELSIGSAVLAQTRLDYKQRERRL